MILENQYQRIINSYKLLYFRKMSNLILEYLFEKYNQYFAKTDNIFLDETKPEEKRKKFAIIGASNKCNEISSINKNLVNLIIDYLMYMKDITSISKANYDIQIEILSEYIGKEIENIDGKYYISSSDLINILFDDKSNINEKKHVKKVNINDKKQDLSKKEDILQKFNDLIIKLENKEKGNILIDMPKNNMESYSYDFDELENILFNNKKKNFNENKILIVKEIKEYAKMIMDIENQEEKEITVINNDYIFKEWKRSFNKSYKSKEEFKLIVKTDNLNNLKIKDIKEALIKLIPDEKFEIFKDAPSKFENMINNKFPSFKTKKNN